MSKLKAYKFLASFFGSGYLPKAPGSWGTLASLIVLLIPDTYLLYSLLGLIVFCTIIFIPIIDRIEDEGINDPGFIVIDEAIGMWIVLLSPYINYNIYTITLGFILFRIFDIAKPFPINKINDKVGGFWVIFDDIIAGIFALVTLQIFVIAYRILPFMLKYLGIIG